MKASTAAILSVVTGKLMCDMGQVSELIEFMVGGPVWTHQIPKVAPTCKFELLKQLPQLGEVDPHIINEKTWGSVLEACVKKYGDSHEVSAIEGYVNSDPLKDLAEML